jgi:hypothetical protein
MTKMNGEPTRILLHFEPEYRAELPPADRFVGEVEIILPEVRVKLLDLSMGGIIPDGPYVGGKGRVWTFRVDFPEPGITAGDMLKFLAEAEPQFREMHQVIQSMMDETFLLGGKK